MNLLQMLTQKRTDPLTQFVDRERMIRGNPTRFVGDFLTRAGGGDPDAGMLDMVDPTRQRQSDVLGLPPLTPAQEKEIQGGFMEAPNSRKEAKAERNSKIKGAITGVGDIFANALQQQPEQRLNFAPLQMGGQSFLIDPTFLQARGLQRREDGGPVKKRKPYLVGEDGPEIVVPEEDGMVIPNRRNINWDVEAAPPQTETVTETVTEPSIADKLRVQIEEYQDPDRYKKGSPRYDKKRNWKDALRSAGYGILQALASAPANSDTASMIGRAIGGAATGGVMGATMDNVDEKMRDQFKLAQLVPQYKEAYGMERQKKTDDETSQYRKAQMANLEEDNRNAKWGRQIQEKELAQQERNRLSREETSRMTAVAGLLKNVPEFIPGDPKYKELEQALGDVKLPVFAKDAKKKVDLKQDQRTGAWTVILTNPVTGQQEVRSVVKDGKPFASTPTVVMQGEYGMLKQNDQQAYQGEQNQLDRNLRTQLQDKALKYGKEKTLTDATNAYKALYLKENGRAPTQAEIDDYINNTIAPMLESGFIPSP